MNFQIKTVSFSSSSKYCSCVYNIKLLMSVIASESSVVRCVRYLVRLNTLKAIKELNCLSEESRGYICQAIKGCDSLVVPIKGR